MYFSESRTNSKFMKGHQTDGGIQQPKGRISKTVTCETPRHWDDGKPKGAQNTQPHTAVTQPSHTGPCTPRCGSISL